MKTRSATRDSNSMGIFGGKFEKMGNEIYGYEFVLSRVRVEPLLNRWPLLFLPVKGQASFTGKQASERR